MTAPRVNRRTLRSASRNNTLLTTAQAAEMTGYAADHVCLLLRRGTLRGERKGRDWFVESASLLEYVNARPKPGPKSG
jgi:hypothetical protein